MVDAGSRGGRHIPVLLNEVLEILDPSPGDVVVDATVGGGGHAGEILERIVPGGRLYALDRDAEAVERAAGVLKDRKDRVMFVNADYRRIEQVVRDSGEPGIDGALFDLGMSSYQVDEPHRGFSFMHDGPLDMRFDKSQRLSARDVVNRFGKRELTDIIRGYGEERHARVVAEEIMRARGRRPIETTAELKDIIVRAIGRKYRNQKLHPAARTFQALRIYVNDELAGLEQALRSTVPLLTDGARICVISFHSLEDRIVKNVFRDLARKGDLRILTKKPLRPDRAELERNPRSRSAKLRAAEREK